MKNKFEIFLNKPWYFLVVVCLSLIIWSLKYYVPDSVILTTTFLLYIPLALGFFLIAYFYENTIYTVPITLSFLFSIGALNMNLDTINHISVAIIPILLVFGGIIGHLIKYKVSFKIKPLSIGLMLASVSFLIPLSYRSFDMNFLLLSSLGLVYLMIYSFYSLTVKPNSLAYLFKSLLWIAALLAFQLSVIIIDFVLSYPSISEGFNNLNSHDLNVDAPGWGNINDLTIHLVLYSSSVIYFINKRPNNILPFILFIWFVIVTFLSFSRGSMVTMSILGLFILFHILKQKNKHQLRTLYLLAFAVLFILVIKFDFFVKTFTDFYHSLDGGLTSMLNGRVKLWDHAIKTFQTYPIFGGGWMRNLYFLMPEQNRAVVYHSTFFQVLAAGGIFGILVLIYHFYEVGKLFKHSHLGYAKFAILTTYLITQFHGLFDNTQYMIYYMTSILIIFSVLGNSKNDTEHSLDYIDSNTEIVV